MVYGLLADRVVEPGGGVVRVKFLGDGILPAIQFRTLFFVIGLAQVAADKGTV